MRLTEQQKAAAVASRPHGARLVRIESEWAVVWTEGERPVRWVGELIKSAEPAADWPGGIKVWWTGGEQTGRRRRQVIAALHELVNDQYADQLADFGDVEDRL